MVVNNFGLRATNPAELSKVADPLEHDRFTLKRIRRWRGSWRISCGLKQLSGKPMRFQVASTVFSAALFSSVLSFAKTCSIGEPSRIFGDGLKDQAAAVWI